MFTWLTLRMAELDPVPCIAVLVGLLFDSAIILLSIEGVIRHTKKSSHESQTTSDEKA